MTRNEFIEDVIYWEDLMSFAYDIEYWFDDVFDDEQFDDMICEYINEQTQHWRWDEIRDYLNNLPTDASYYVSTQDGYEDAYYYFDDYKNEVLDYCDDHDIWEEEEDEEEVEQVEEVRTEPEEPAFEIEDEDMLVEMFSANSEEVAMMYEKKNSEAIAEEIKQETEFKTFIAEAGVR